jgi:hypothetical protein
VLTAVVQRENDTDSAGTKLPPDVSLRAFATVSRTGEGVILTSPVGNQSDRNDCLRGSFESGHGNQSAEPPTRTLINSPSTGVRRVETPGDRRRHAESDGKEFTGVESETTNRSTGAPSVVQSPSKNRVTQPRFALTSKLLINGLVITSQANSKVI